jgi:hypothetical protein
LSFVLIVAESAMPIGGVDKSFRDFEVPSREPKLFPHFGEAGIAIFFVQKIEHGGHDLNPVI